MMVGRLLLGCVFVYAAYTKLWTVELSNSGFLGLRLEWRSWAIFAMSINSYQILPEPFVIFVARVLPWVELALGILLIGGWKLRYTAAATSALLAGFFAVMLRSYFKGQGIDCGCFGVGEALSARTLARDGALVALSLGLTGAAFLSPRKPTQETAAQG